MIKDKSTAQIKGASIASAWAASMPHRTPSPDTLRKRNTVTIGTERVGNITSTDIPGHYPSEDHTWSLPTFRQNLNVTFHRNTPTEAIFSLTGCDASLANAFRRILLSELPTLAIEEVFIRQNTSIIQDEVLAHRLGLIPLKANRAALKWLRPKRKAEEDSDRPADPAYDHNTVQLSLCIKSEWRDGARDAAKKGESDPELLFTNTAVYARDIEFHPVGQQTTLFSPAAGAVVPTNPDILIAKLRPGNELDITVHAQMGLGRDHAKFSPVATASYRLMPIIDILQPITGSDARKFARCFPRGVIGLRDTDGDVEAFVQDPMRDTVSRECLRHPEFEGKVKLGRRRDHFIFSVEGTGQWDSDDMFLDSIAVLRQKCVDMKRCLAALRENV